MQVGDGEYKQERGCQDFFPITRVKWLSVLFQPLHKPVKVLYEGELVLSWKEELKTIPLYILNGEFSIFLLAYYVIPISKKKSSLEKL